MFTLCLIGIFLAFQRNVPPPDMVLINDIVMTTMQNDDSAVTVNLLAQELTQAFENMDTARRNRDHTLQILLSLIMFAFAITSVGFYLYCDRNILAPFRRLQSFARRIADGNLDIPLAMDKDNLFGAFTESFDLMREELHKARTNERLANQSKKELVATLSHDIKTPIASIKAVTELMLVGSISEKEQERLNTINAKAEQIDALITNMFHATLEELKELRVASTEIQSTEIPNLIRNADYENRVKPFSIPNCLLSVDSLRLQQVFDNIINNSYKYADSDIEINSSFGKQYLIIEIKDFGAGVAENELPLLFNKFYRGKNAETSGGYGLGLFISKYLMQQMGGDLFCENQTDGFMVKILLRLAS